MTFSILDILWETSAIVRVEFNQKIWKMSPPQIIPMILSGGEGSRLWPLSRDSKPKQFISFDRGYSFFQQTVLRCREPIFDETPIVVSSESHRFLIAQNLNSIGAKADILLEPIRRDTCAAIAAGSLRAIERNPSAMVLILAADHVIADKRAFVDTICDASVDAAEGHLVTFGIKPKYAATGYGYIRAGKRLRENGCALVEHFLEKPEAALAEKYVVDGYLWNSGNFLFNAASFVEELAVYEPDILSAARNSLTLAKRETDFIWLNLQSFCTSPQRSVDCAIMEKTKKAVVLAVDYGWRDIGSWDAVHALLAKDENENVLIGRCASLEGQNNLIHSVKHFTLASNVSDLIVVVTDDVVMITKRGGAERVKELLTKFKEYTQQQ
jgi:mannose-1-phosphate guanylyltransferase / mannose-6-phosphate isomerase